MNDELRESRFDFSVLNSKPTKTQQGFLRVPGQIARTGILEYKLLTGGTRRELRHPDEVFKADSLDSLKGAPITDLHHGLVDSVNVDQYSVGVVVDTIEHDQQWVRGQLTIQREDAVKSVESGDRKELSAGYTCSMEYVPGVYQGERYDAKQKDIIYNHVAIGPDGWARSGPDAVIKMDGLDTTAAVSGIEIKQDDFRQEIKDMSTKKVVLKLDGFTYETEIAEPLAANFEQGINKMREDGAAATTKVSELEGKLAAEEKAHADLQEKFDSLNSAEQIEAAVKERLALISEAQKIAPELKCDGLSTREIKIAALEKNEWKPERFDGKDDAYLSGVFAGVLAAPKVETKINMPDPNPDTKEDGQEVKYDSKAARQKMMNGYAWDTKDTESN
jgi:hypothetical protein